MEHLYVSDLDGTLLRSDATLSEYSRTTLNRLISEGLLFTVATARGIHSIQTLLKGCTLNLPVIEFNGAYITDFNTGEHLSANVIESALSHEVYGLMKEYHGDPFVTTNDGEDHLFYRSLSSKGMQEYYNDRVGILDKRLQQVDDLESKLHHDVLCMTVINTYDVLQPLRERLASELGEHAEIHFWDNMYWPGSWWLTVQDKNATKGKALVKLAEMLSHSVDEITVFGDHVQDIPLFDIGKRKVAVANAIDEIKPLATHHIGLNEEDSVIRFIEGEWSGPSLFRA